MINHVTLSGKMMRWLASLKLRNIRHISKLERNLISIRQLADEEMKTTFDDDVCKIPNGAMVMA